MASLRDVTKIVLGNPAPVLMMDTCSILDIVRMTARGKAHLMQDAQRVIAGARNRRCHLIASSVIAKEYAHNLQAEIDKLAKCLEDMDAFAEQVGIACRALGEPEPPRPGYASSGVLKQVTNLADAVVRSATHLDLEDVLAGRAMARTVHKRVPAHRGAAAKDCQLFEECLEVGRSLRSCSFGDTLVFMTSNSDDFCGPGSKQAHKDIASDLAQLGIEFSMHWNHTAHLLRV